MSEDNTNLTSLDLLNRFAIFSERKIVTTEEKISHRHGHTKRTAIIEDVQSETLLLWYSNPSNISDFSLFWGAAFPHTMSNECNISVGKSSFWNRIPFVGPMKRNQTENHIVSSDFIIRGKGFEEIEMIFDKSLIHDLMREILEVDQRIRIYFNTVNMDFCSQCKGKSTVSVIVRDHWEFEHSKIEKIFGLTDKLRVLMRS
jgi:hypothetical protein